MCVIMYEIMFKCFIWLSCRHLGRLYRHCTLCSLHTHDKVRPNVSDSMHSAHSRFGIRLVNYLIIITNVRLSHNLLTLRLIHSILLFHCIDLSLLFHAEFYDSITFLTNSFVDICKTVKLLSINL